jgi:xylan 1,4-beta-xylosidase
MFGLLGSDRVKASSSATLPTEDVVATGVRGQPEVGVVATRKNREVEILVWNYHDDDLPAAAAPIDLSLSGLPIEVKRAMMEHFRVDSDHSNAFSAWKAIGSPASLSQSQQEALEKSGQLQLLGSPERISIENKTLRLHFDLPRQGLSLLRISW